MVLAKVKEFLKELGINSEGLKLKDTEAVIHFSDSNAFSKAYTKLSNSDLVDLDIENVTVDEDGSHMLYMADDYDIYLDADYDTDNYTLTLQEVLGVK